ncbi:MAG: DUF3857 domain-containing protein [Bacteroidia bacterium]
MLSKIKFNYTGFLLAVCFGCPVISFAQKEINAEEYRKQFPNDQVVELSLSEEMLIQTTSGGIQVTSKHNSQVLYLTDRAPDYANKYLSYYEQFQKIQEVEGEVLTPSAKGYKKSGIATVIESKGIDKQHFYDDQQELKLTFPGLKSGAITNMQYTENMFDAHHVGGFFFQKYVPVQKAQFKVVFPSNVKLQYILRGDTSALKFSERTEGKNTIYTWSAENIAKLPYETDAPNMRYYIPHVLIYIEEYTIKGKTVPVFKDVAHLHNWYTELLKDVETKPDDNIKKITDSLISGVAENHEKTRRIFYWVQDHVRYIAFEDGYGGYIPRQASAVCLKRYGDCKDMANLLVVMLNYAKIPAWHSWIGTREIPYSYTDVPTGAVDNHMIAVAEVENKFFFLDATGGRIPLGLPTPMIQGKQTLMHLAKDKYDVKTIEQVKSNRNLTLDTTKLTIKGDELEGQGNVTYTGFEKFTLSSSLAYYSKEKQLEELKERHQRGNNKCNIKHLTYNGMLDRDSNFRVNYDFSLPQYMVQNGNELFVNMYLDKPLKKNLIDTAQKKLDKEIEYKFQYNTLTSLEIPKGYNVGSLPEPVTYKGKAYGFKSSYKKENNKVFLQQELYVDTLLLAREDFEDWNKMIKSLQEVYRQSVVLKKN